MKDFKPWYITFCILFGFAVPLIWILSVPFWYVLKLAMGEVQINRPYDNNYGLDENNQ